MHRRKEKKKKNEVPSFTRGRRKRGKRKLSIEKDKNGTVM